MRNLLEFLTRHYHWFLFVALEVVSAMLLFRYNSYQSSVWVSSANAVTGRIFEWESAVESFFSLTRVNEELTLRNFYLERKVNQLSTLYAEATGEKADTGSGELKMLSRYSLIPAKVVSNSLDREDNLITINRGRADGITPDMGVACGTGVVGVTYLVSDNYTVVLPVINTRSRISCAIRGHGYFGYLHWTGGDSGFAYVEDIPRHARFRRGDWVETNGYSSIFPPGVLIGKIVQVYNSRDGLSYRLKVQLTTDFGNLRDVCVINDRGIAEKAMIINAARDSMQNTVRR